MHMTHSDIQQRIAKLGMTQERLAQQLDYDPTLFSRLIRGLRAAPHGFEERVSRALDRLEAAERAAEEARARVLAEMASEEE